MQPSNGRVDVPLDGRPVVAFSLFGSAGPGPDGGSGDGSHGAGGFARGTLKHKLQASPASDLFFSSANVERLHRGMRHGVYEKSGLVVSRQSDVELGLVMRSIFLSLSVNGDDPTGEVLELNRAVLEYCVKTVCQEAAMYVRYRQDASQIAEPMPRGEFSSSKGTRVLLTGPR
jgi:hypothetical protein